MIRLITSRITFRYVARCRQFVELKPIMFRSIPFVREVERSAVRAEQKGVISKLSRYWGFWDQIRSSVHALVRLLQCKPIMPLPHVTLSIILPPLVTPFHRSSIPKFIYPLTYDEKVLGRINTK